MLKKPRKKDRLKVIEELTTHKSDYKAWPVNPATTFSGVQERFEKKQKPPPLHVQIDYETHYPWKFGPYVPFDHYGHPKAIIGENPWYCFENRKLPEDDKSVRKTRPRLTLTPQLPIDDVEDPEALDIILRYTYLSDVKKFQEEAALPVTKQATTPVTVLAGGNENIKFSPETFTKIPPDWLSAAKHWDTLQCRKLGDPFKTFWSRKGPDIQCGCCCNPIPKMLPPQEKQHIRDLICDHKLRLPYDITKVGYTGFRTSVAANIPLEQEKGFGVDPSQ